MSDVLRTPSSADGPSKLTSVASGTDATTPTRPVVNPRPRTGWRAFAAGIITAIMLVVTLGVAAFAQTGKAADGPTFLSPGAFLYAELRLDLPGDQREQLMSFLGHLPGFADPSAFDTKLDETLDQMLGGPGSPISWTQDVKPWFGGQIMLGVSSVPPMDPSGTMTTQTAPVVIAIGSTDRTALDASLAKLVSGPNMASVTSEDYAGTTIWSSDSGSSITALAPTDGLLLLSNDITELKASLDLLAAGGPSLADDATYQAAIATLPADRVGAFYVDSAQLKDALLPLAEQSLQAQPSMGISSDQLKAGLALLPPTITGYIRVDADHLTFRLDAPVAEGSALSVRSTDIASKMPADTIVYLETRDLGGGLKTILSQLKSLLAAQGNDQALAQIEALLGTGLDSYLDWVQDVGIGASLSAAGPSVGLVATVSDEATGQQRIDSLLMLIRAISATADPSPVDITTEDVNGTKVTTISLTDASGMTARLPVEARISIALGDGHLYLGLGDFAKEALSRDPADSLASAAGYTKAAAAAGDNAGLVYVDVASTLSFAELMMSSDQRTMFESQIKPYADALDFIVASINQDASSSSASMMLFVK